MKELIGRKITAIGISEDNTWLVFQTIQDKFMNGNWAGRHAIYENLYYYTEGDCCSNSWVEHFDGVAQMADNSIVVSVESVPGGCKETTKSCDFTDRDEIACYFIKFVTDKGTATLEFRNESNGYYGGWIELVTDKEIIAKECVFMKKILEDF